jgi:hypothetical protein
MTGPRRVDPGAVALTAFCLAAAGLIVVHLLRRDYEVRSHMISDYAVGPQGWVMVAVFLALSAGYLALAVGFVELGPRSWPARLGAVLLGFVCVGLVISALFPTDLPGTKLTRSGEIHEISFLVNVGCSVVAVLLLGASFGRDPRWSSFRAPSLVLGGVIMLALVIQFRTLHRGAPYGYANRFFVAALLAWLLGASSWLRAVGRHAGRAAPRPAQPPQR